MTNLQLCPQCGRPWKPGLILQAMRGCKTCQNERERRAALWVGDPPIVPAPAKPTDKLPEVQSPKLKQRGSLSAMPPARSLIDLLDDLADLGISITLNGDRLSTNKKPPDALLTELIARKLLLILALRTFAEADANNPDPDPDLREWLRFDCLASALELAGEEAEAKASKRRADALLRKIGAK